MCIYIYVYIIHHEQMPLFIIYLDLIRFVKVDGTLGIPLILAFFWIVFPESV